MTKTKKQLRAEVVERLSVYQEHAAEWQIDITNNGVIGCLCGGDESPAVMSAEYALERLLYVLADDDSTIPEADSTTESLSEGLPERDAVAILRKYANLWGAAHVTMTQCGINWEAETMSALANMVERDYIRKEDAAEYILSIAPTIESTQSEDVAAGVVRGTLERDYVRRDSLNCSACAKELERVTSERDEWKAKAEGYAEACEKLGCSVLANGTVFTNANLLAENDVMAENACANDGKAQYVETGACEPKQVVDKQADSREKLEADIGDALGVFQHHESDHVDMATIRRWLDRQAAITERESLTSRLDSYELATMIDTSIKERNELEANLAETRELLSQAHLDWLDDVGEYEKTIDELESANERQARKIRNVCELNAKLTVERNELQRKLDIADRHEAESDEACDECKAHFDELLSELTAERDEYRDRLSKAFNLAQQLEERLGDEWDSR